MSLLTTNFQMAEQNYYKAVNDAVANAKLKQTLVPILRLFNLTEKQGGKRPGLDFRNSLVRTIEELQTTLNEFDKICNCLKSTSWFFGTKDIDYKQEKNYESVCKSVQQSIDSCKSSILLVVKDSIREPLVDIPHKLLPTEYDKLSKSINITDYKNKKEEFEKSEEHKEAMELISVIKKECENHPVAFAHTMANYFSKKECVSETLVDSLSKLVKLVSGQEINKNLEESAKMINNYMKTATNNKVLDFSVSKITVQMFRDAIQKNLNFLQGGQRKILFSKKHRQEVVDSINRMFVFKDFNVPILK